MGRGQGPHLHEQDFGVSVCVCVCLEPRLFKFFFLLHPTDGLFAFPHPCAANRRHAARCAADAARCAADAASRFAASSAPSSCRAAGGAGGRRVRVGRAAAGVRGSQAGGRAVGRCVGQVRTASARHELPRAQGGDAAAQQATSRRPDSRHFSHCGPRARGLLHRCDPSTAEERRRVSKAPRGRRIWRGAGWHIAPLEYTACTLGPEGGCMHRVLLGRCCFTRHFRGVYLRQSSLPRISRARRRGPAESPTDTPRRGAAGRGGPGSPHTPDGTRGRRRGREQASHE